MERVGGRLRTLLRGCPTTARKALPVRPRTECEEGGVWERSESGKSMLDSACSLDPNCACSIRNDGRRIGPSGKRRLAERWGGRHFDLGRHSTAFVANMQAVCAVSRVIRFRAGITFPSMASGGICPMAQSRTAENMSSTFLTTAERRHDHPARLRLRVRMRSETPAQIPTSKSKPHVSALQSHLAG